MVIQEAVRFGEGHFYTDEDSADFFESDLEKSSEFFESPDTEEDERPSGPETEVYAKWTDRYIEARNYLYGTDESEPDEEAAYEIMKEEAENGNAYAMYDMGMLCKKGIFIEADEDMSNWWFQMALKGLLDVESRWKYRSLEYRIGNMFLNGVGTEKDECKAEYYLLKAKEDGNKNACYGLGKLYLISEEGLKNIELAVKYLTEAADTGNQYAQYLLGKLYLLGKDISQDKEKAYEYLKSAAEQGNVYAAYFLEYWNNMLNPDLLLMATRLMKHLEQIIQDDVTGRRNGRAGGIDRRLAKKLKQKKVAQGHAKDEHQEMVQVQ